MSDRIRPAEAADRPALFSLFAVAFGGPADPDAWAWKYDRNPNSAPSVVAVEDGSVVAFYGGFGTRYCGAEGAPPGVAATDVMTHPRARKLGRHGLFRRVVEEWNRRCGEAGIPFGFGFPNERHLLVGVRTTGYNAIEPVTEWSRPLAAPSRLSRLRRRFLRIAAGEPFGAPHDALAEILHARAGWRTERSRRVLNWRFCERPGVSYRTWQVLDRRGSSRAYAVVRIAGDRAILADLQADDERSGVLVDLLAAVSDDLRGTPAKTLALRASARSVLAERAGGEMGFSPHPSDATLAMRTFLPGVDLEHVSSRFDYRFGDHEIF